MSMVFAVLYIVTARNCGACTRYKQMYREKTKADLDKIKGLKVEKIDVNKIGDPLPEAFPKDLQRFIKWYPTFVLVTKTSNDNKGGKLDGVVFNGKENNNSAFEHTGSGGYTLDNVGITKWVKDNLEGGVLFKKLGPSMAPLHSQKPQKSNNVRSKIEDDDQEIYTKAYCSQSFIPYH